MTYFRLLILGAFLGIAGGFAFWFFRPGGAPTRGLPMTDVSTSLGILQERYAKGGLSREEYIQMVTGLRQPGR